MTVVSRGLVAALALTSAGCAVPVVVSLDDAEAARAVAVLEKGGVAATARPGGSGRGNAVEVGRADAERALEILAAHPPKSGSPTLLDAFSDPGVMPSRLAERAKLASGIAGDLERTLGHLQGVALARVHVSLPESSPLIADRPQAPTASVLILHDGERPAIAPAEVQRIVAGAVVNLAPEGVTIVMRPREPAETPRAELARLGPLTTTRAGLAAARATVGIVIGSNLILLGLLFVLWRRANRARPALRTEGE